MNMKKNPNDLIISDGKLVGKFEDLYNDFEDPWGQADKVNRIESFIIQYFIKKFKPNTVLDIGCGNGHITNLIHSLDVKTYGTDTSKAAIENAKKLYKGPEFITSDFSNFQLYREIKPDFILMAELSWYVLDELKDFIDFIKKDLKHTNILHFLTIYPEGEQKYGKDYFTNLDEILNFFDANYIEHGQLGIFGGKQSMSLPEISFFLGNYSLE